jgi:hypothetical protein
VWLDYTNSDPRHRDLISVKACERANHPWPIWLAAGDEAPHLTPRVEATPNGELHYRAIVVGAGWCLTHCPGLVERAAFGGEPDGVEPEA